MLKVYLIRHGKTEGNRQGRYIGSRTDEPLCGEGMALLKEKEYPEVDRIYASPMRRCIQTARILWPEYPGELKLIEALKECDFGDFENKNYQELSGNPDYQAWIDSGGTLPFPNGESTGQFKERCRQGFLQIIRMEQENGVRETGPDGETASGDREKDHCIAVVAHGGTIMAILEAFGTPAQNYFDYQVKNGCGYLLTPVEGTKLWNYQSLQ